MVVYRPRPKPAPRPVPKPVPLAIVGQSVAEGQQITGLVIWRVDIRGRAERVEFLVDGVVRGSDVAAPYTFGWNADAEPAGPHVLTARAVGVKTVDASVTVASAGTAAP